MVSLLLLIVKILDIYWWVVVLAALMSWLAQFNVVNPRNRVVAAVGEFLWRATEPVLRPIRRFVPLIGGVDISPVVVILLIWFAQDLIIRYLVPAAY
jgi:YggT family protein